MDAGVSIKGSHGWLQHLSVLGLLLAKCQWWQSICEQPKYCHPIFNYKNWSWKWEHISVNLLLAVCKVLWLTQAQWRSGWSRWRERRGRRRPRKLRTWSPPVWSTAGGKQEEEGTAFKHLIMHLSSFVYRWKQTETWANINLPKKKQKQNTKYVFPFLASSPNSAPNTLFNQDLTWPETRTQSL